MKNLIVLLTCLGLSASLLADNPQSEMKEKPTVIKTSVIKTSGDPQEKSISEIISWVESETDGDTNVEVFVTVDGGGEMTIEKNGSTKRKHGVQKFIGGRSMPHVMAFAGSQHQAPHKRHKRMSTGAANCILKNISKVNSDSAAHLLKQACVSLNPSKEKSKDD